MSRCLHIINTIHSFRFYFPHMRIFQNIHLYMHATHIIISQGITTYIYTYKKGGKGYLATKNTDYIANYCLGRAPLPE